MSYPPAPPPPLNTKKSWSFFYFYYYSLPYKLPFDLLKLSCQVSQEFKIFLEHHFCDFHFFTGYDILVTFFSELIPACPKRDHFKSDAAPKAPRNAPPHFQGWRTRPQVFTKKWERVDQTWTDICTWVRCALGVTLPMTWVISYFWSSILL